MPKKQSPREALALHMEDRRVSLGLRWADVADLAGTTTETLRQARFGDGEIRPLTRRGIEDALGWARGSVAAVLAGGQPTVTTEVAPIKNSSDIQTSSSLPPSIEEAIGADPDLLDEAKQHLLNQYHLLRRLAPAEPSEATGRQTRRQPLHLADEQPLQAVAERGDPADRAEMERRAREARRRQPRKTGRTDDDSDR